MIGILSYLIFFITIAAILSIAVLGLNLQWGNTGLFNGGVAAFLGAGAYATILLGGTPQPEHIGGFGIFYPFALMGGALFAGALAWLVGMLTLKLRHDYLAIATFGVAVAFESFVRNTTVITGGALGLRGFERPLEELIGNPLLYNIFFFLVVIVVLAVVHIFLEKLVHSPFGRLLRAIREDETAAQSLGKNPRRIRLTAFIIGSVILGLAGGLYATYYAFISPQDVVPTLTFQIWAMLIVGGAGNNRGAIAGAFLIWAVWTGSGWCLSKYAPVEAQIYTGTLQYILIGTIIVLMLLLRPQGIFPERLVISQSKG